MFNRRQFLQTSGLGGLAALAAPRWGKNSGKNSPVVVSTWAPNTKANAAAFAVLQNGGSVLDAVEKGIWVPEADPTDQSVGYGGLPDRDGHVTVDACIMDAQGGCGAVMALEHILHPISVARRVMERSPHVQLVGEGALLFALAQGFEKQNLLTPEAEKAWRAWLKEARYDPQSSIDVLNRQSKQALPGGQHNHDTIGLLALDNADQLAGGCSTSGMAYKMRGRVGDSPIIGAGLFVDGEVGAATATGVGEEVVRVCGSHTVVEAMRQGLSPEASCRRAVERIRQMRGAAATTLQVGFIALSRSGQVGAYALQKGFTYAVQSAAGVRVAEAKSLFS